MTVCPKCGQPVERVTGKTIYPNHSKLHDRRFLACLICDVRAPLNRKGKPTAALADGPTRKLRQQAHAAFDPLWQRGGMTRSAAYAWLRCTLGMTERDCHMAWMGAADLRKVIEVCRQKENPA